jgi:ribonucleotide reductase beta subunit family protein with ferritin-like domain
MVLLAYFKKKYIPDTKRIHQIFAEAVECESLFAEEALPKELPGMNSKLMLQYVKYCADYLLDFMEQPKIYNAENPFEFMENMSLSKRGNFFEVKNTDYNFFPAVGEDIFNEISTQNVDDVDEEYHKRSRLDSSKFDVKKRFKST